MPTLHERIRQARALSRMTQTDLADRIGVGRGAVAQWESATGSSPSMEHLIAIALQTGVHLEWLGTGRGDPRPGMTFPRPEEDDRALDTMERNCLRMLRRMPRRLRAQMFSVIKAASR